LTLPELREKYYPALTLWRGGLTVKMETGTVLALIGIALTILSIYLMMRRRYPGRVTFIRESSIALFDMIVKNFPEIQVVFEGNAVQPDLVLLSGALVNSGRIDISPLVTEMPIEIGLPTGFEWLMAKIVSTSPNLEAEVKVEGGQRLVLTSGLFRQGEFVRFQALAKVPLGEEIGRSSQESLSVRLEKSLTFSHRIADTREIDVKKLQDIEGLKRTVYRGPRAILYITVFLITMSILMAYILSWPAVLVYSYKPDNKNALEVKVNPRTNGTLMLEGTKEWFIAESDVPNFVQKSSGPIGVVQKDSLFDWLTRILGIPLFFTCYWLYYLLLYREQRRILKMLDIHT
jgi:hypothetical protein